MSPDESFFVNLKSPHDLGLFNRVQRGHHGAGLRNTETMSFQARLCGCFTTFHLGGRRFGPFLRGSSDGLFLRETGISQILEDL